MLVKAVTSVNLPYHQKYGRQLLDSFLTHVDPQIPLVYYHEGAQEPGGFVAYSLQPPSPRIQPRDLYTGGLGEFLRKAAPLVTAKIGAVDPDPDNRLGRPGYGYLWDALTFARKAFAWIGTWQQTQARYLFWLDADIVFHAPMPADVFIGLFQGADVVCFQRKRPHTETGFYGVDITTPGGKAFCSAYENWWVKGKVFDLKNGWTDSHVFDAACETANPAIRNLSTQPTGHVMATSPLAAYFDHRKGRRKQTGASPELQARQPTAHRTPRLPVPAPEG